MRNRKKPAPAPVPGSAAARRVEKRKTIRELRGMADSIRVKFRTWDGDGKVTVVRIGDNKTVTVQPDGEIMQ